jgi:N-acyl-D-aspartate/D-glutamate deacylase
MFDTKIVNGSIVDGTGRPAFEGELGIRDGRIVAIGKVDEASREVVDAGGKVVAPGFIDSHTHYDAQVFWDPFLTPSCYHGVTTVLAGNCGFSIAPLTPDAATYIGPMLARVEGIPLETLRQGVPWDWRTFGEYLEKLEGNLGVNAGFMVGHSAVRRVVMGKRAIGHKATAAEIAAMRKMVSDSLAEGALGFSSTVSTSHNDADGNPVPSRHGSREELLVLAGACREHEGTFLELLPNLESHQEMTDLLVDYSLAGQRLVNWNVLVLQGSDDSQVAEAKRQLAISDYARSKGAIVMPLSFAAAPTMRLNFWSGFIFDGMPDWAPLFRMSKAERIEKLKHPEYRRFLDERANSEDALHTMKFASWREYRICETFSAETKPYAGRLVGEVATELGKSPFDAMLDIVVADGLKTVFLAPQGSNDHETFRHRAEIWKHKDVIIGASDAGAHMDMIDTFAFSTGLLQMAVREQGVLTLEEAVHALTEAPARMMGLRKRGILKVGWHADIVIFDPKTVTRSEVYTRFDLPGNEGRLYCDAVGIQRVMVNGQTIVDQGKHTGAKPGIVLKSGRDSYTVKIPAVA